MSSSPGVLLVFSRPGARRAMEGSFDCSWGPMGGIPGQKTTYSRRMGG